MSQFWVKVYSLNFVLSIIFSFLIIAIFLCSNYSRNEKNIDSLKGLKKVHVTYLFQTKFRRIKVIEAENVKNCCFLRKNDKVLNLITSAKSCIFVQVPFGNFVRALIIRHFARFQMWVTLLTRSVFLTKFYLSPLRAFQGATPLLLKQ